MDQRPNSRSQAATHCTYVEDEYFMAAVHSRPDTEVCAPRAARKSGDSSGRPVGGCHRGPEYRVDARAATTAAASPLRFIDNPGQFLDKRQAPVTVAGEATARRSPIWRCPAVQAVKELCKRAPVRSASQVAPNIAVLHVVHMARICWAAWGSGLLLPHQPRLRVTDCAVAVVDEPIFGLRQRRSHHQQHRACDNRQTCFSDV